MNKSQSPNEPTQSLQSPTKYRAWLKFCYYLRMQDAKFIHDPAPEGLFEVPADAQWVVVRRRLDGKWLVVIPLLNDGQASSERKSGQQVELSLVCGSANEGNSWILDISERYPLNLFEEAEADYGKRQRECTVKPIAPPETSSNEQYPKAQLRYCYYLHLGKADKTEKSDSGTAKFQVPYKRRWVLVRKYFRDGTAQIHQLTSDVETESGLQKSFHVWLGNVVPKSSKNSWAQCIQERYPERLMNEAEMDSGKTRAYCDVMATLSYFKAIDRGSPDHWIPEERLPSPGELSCV